MSHVHVSDIRAFKSCRLRWQFSSPLRLGMSPKYPATSMWLGTLVHEVLDAYYNPLVAEVDWRKILDDLFEAQVSRLLQLFGQRDDYNAMLDKYIDVQAQAVGILENYFEVCPPLDQDLRVVASEQSFELPFDTDVTFAGRFDLIVKTPDSKLWVFDHKTTRIDFGTFLGQIVDRDDQARAYVWALQQMYPDDQVGGIIYNMIKSKAPEEPQLLKKGGLSKAKNQETTVALYNRAIARYDLDVTDYLDILYALSEREKVNPYVVRVPVTFSPSVIDVWTQFTRAVVREMVGNPVIYPQQSPFMCRGCSFSGPCAAFFSHGWIAASRLLESNYVASRYAEDARMRAAHDTFDVEIIDD